MALLESDRDLENSLVRAFAIIGAAAQLQRVWLGSEDATCPLITCEWVGPRLLRRGSRRLPHQLSVSCGESRCERIYFERRSAHSDWSADERLTFDVLGRAVGAALARREMALARQDLELRHQAFVEGEMASFERRRALHLLIGSIPNLLLLADDQDHISALFAPPQFRAYLGQQGIELGAPLAVFLPDGEALRLRKALVQVRVSRELVRLEYQLPVAGQPHWFQVRLSPVGDSSDVLVLIDDISDQRQAEEALTRRDAILETLAYSSEQLLLGNPVSVIPQLLERLGATIQICQVAMLDVTPGQGGDFSVRVRAAWQRQDRQALPGLELSLWRERLSAGHSVYGALHEFPAEEQRILARLGFQSLALVPVFSDGAWCSVLAFGETRWPRTWLNAEIEAFKNIAATLGAAFARQRIESDEQEQRALIEALRDVGATLNRTLDLDEVLDQILTQLGRVVPHDSANIILLDEGIARIARATGYRERGALDALGMVYFPVNTLFSIRDIIDAGQPVVIPDTRARRDWAALPATKWVRSYAGAPIRVEGELIGLLNIDSATPGFLTRQHAEHLQAFADQAAIAIRNARLYNRVESLAAFQERQRLARELHDGVSQSLSSANLIADVLPRVWEQSPERGRSALNQLHELTGSALAEMRMLLMELRPETIYAMKLHELLARLVRVAASRGGLQIDLNVEGEREPDGSIKFAFYRIAQESLNNVVKHARATHAAVQLSLGTEDASLQVIDNGAGFMPDFVPPDHYGLRFMSERAEEIGAYFSIESAAGQGTRISVRWAREEAVSA